MPRLRWDYLSDIVDAGVLPQYRDWFQQHPFPRFTNPAEQAPLIEEVEDDAVA